jgi:hypothetical protein
VHVGSGGLSTASSAWPAALGPPVHGRQLSHARGKATGNRVRAVYSAAKTDKWVRLHFDISMIFTHPKFEIQNGDLTNVKKNTQIL